MAYQDFFSSQPDTRFAKIAAPTLGGLTQPSSQRDFTFDPTEVPWYRQDPYSAGNARDAMLPEPRERGFAGAYEAKPKNPYDGFGELGSALGRSRIGSPGGLSPLGEPPFASALGSLSPGGGTSYPSLAERTLYSAMGSAPGTGRGIYSNRAGIEAAYAAAGITPWWMGQPAPGMDPGTGGGTIGSGGPGWENVNRWDAYVTAAAAATGVPANMLKAVMRFESEGNPNARSPQGAFGLMQIMPFWNGEWGLDYQDPAQNVMLGAKILKQNYDRYGSWEMAAKAYLGFGVDAHGTTGGVYWNRVNGYWQELNASGGRGYGGGGLPRPGTTGTGVGTQGIFGGNSYRQSQPFGRTAWSTGAGSWMYGYAAGLGVPGGHPGIDYSMPAGTRVYIPKSGTVIRGGGSGSFRDVHGDGPGRGELRIQTDDGHLIIFGHMSNIPWRPGQRVTAGQLAGLTGDFNGEHLHLEVRVPGNTSTGWQAVDPEQYFGGMSVAYGGGAPGGGMQPTAPASPYDWIWANMSGF